MIKTIQSVVNKTSNNKSIIIKLENVYKRYYSGKIFFDALKNINLVIYEGEFIAIRGPSGAGKSTLMNLIGCLDVPTRGNIFLMGKNVVKLSESDLATIRGKKIGFIFQQYNLIPTLSAIENVMLPMTFQNVPYSIKYKRAYELLRLVGLENSIFHKPGELSGGQQQRVAIARALSNNPKLILADEPTGNLDSKSGNVVLDYLNQLNKEGKTIVLVTHNEKSALRAKRIVYIKDGTLVNKNEIL